MKKILVAGILASLATLATGASADSVFLTMTAAKAGAIQGSVTQKGRENKIEVIAVDHTVSGAASGRKNHGVLTITKVVDKSSPTLYRVLTTGDTITSFELQFWTPQMSGAGGAGMERNSYTVKLTNARIVDIKYHQLNNKVPSLTRYDDSEEVSFSYEKITWTWNDGGITASDSAN